jgi:hypothetical protein
MSRRADGNGISTLIQVLFIQLLVFFLISEVVFLGLWHLTVQLCSPNYIV